MSGFDSGLVGFGAVMLALAAFVHVLTWLRYKAALRTHERADGKLAEAIEYHGRTCGKLREWASARYNVTATLLDREEVTDEVAHGGQQGAD